VLYNALSMYDWASLYNETSVAAADSPRSQVEERGGQEGERKKGGMRRK
jgi:hypothetical protein